MGQSSLNNNFNSPEMVSVLDELPLWSAPFGLKLLDTIKVKKNISALDIGFGTGFPLLEIAMRLGQSCKVYGLDPWQLAIERTKKKIELYGIHNVELLEGCAENIPLANESIDLIVSNNGLNNVGDLEKSLNECSRIAKKNAQLVFTYNLDTSFIEFYNILEKILKERGMNNEITEMHNHIYNKRKPLKEYLALLEKNKFIVNQVIEDRFLFKYSDGTAMLNHHFVRLAFLPAWKDVIPAASQDEIFDLVEKELNDQAAQKGFFQLTIPFAVIDCSKA